MAMLQLHTTFAFAACFALWRKDGKTVTYAAPFQGVV